MQVAFHVERFMPQLPAIGIWIAGPILIGLSYVCTKMKEARIQSVYQLLIWFGEIERS